jgi:hypothetical protein
MLEFQLKHTNRRIRRMSLHTSPRQIFAKCALGNNFHPINTEHSIRRQLASAAEKQSF